MRLDNISIEYAGTGKLAVADVSLSLGQGEKLALLGPSGCGKSSILNAVLGLLDKSVARVSGSVSVAPGKVSAVFGRPALFPWFSVASNVAFPLTVAGAGPEAGRKVADLLKMGGLAASAGYLPLQLSAGMQQRVSFLRALASTPELILMDEPFSSLDVKTKEGLIKDFLSILAESGASLLFVTHDIREALAMGDRILILGSSPARCRNEYRLKGLSAAERAELIPLIAAEYEE